MFSRTKENVQGRKPSETPIHPRQQELPSSIPEIRKNLGPSRDTSREKEKQRSFEVDRTKVLKAQLDRLFTELDQIQERANDRAQPNQEQDTLERKPPDSPKGPD